jgi:hypothetical protein
VWRGLCLDYVLPQLDARASSQPTSELYTVRDAVVAWAEDDRIARALEVLPRTLVHRDMHDGNVVVGSDGTTIIDWGNAFAGPAWVDLENIAVRHSPGVANYDATWEAVTGEERNPWLDEVGWSWATVQVRAQYLAVPVAAGNLAWAAQMVREADEALVALGQTLAGESGP